VTSPDDEPTHSISENGSTVNAVGTGAGSRADGGSCKSWRGVYVVMVVVQSRVNNWWRSRSYENAT